MGGDGLPDLFSAKASETIERYTWSRTSGLVLALLARENWQHKKTVTHLSHRNPAAVHGECGRGRRSG